MPEYITYPIGTPGQPWGEAEKEAWRVSQPKKRDYFTDVVSRVLRVGAFDVEQYGTLDYRRYGSALFPLYSVKSKAWDAAKPMVVVTGGVHGYETSGVHGALKFIEEEMEKVASKGVNVVVLPCVSPWGYEAVNRWTPEAVDPNRQFVPEKPGCPEAAAAMACIDAAAKQSKSVLFHADLHETTDTDNSEFTPAKTARDGAEKPEWDPIPDGFYLVGDAERLDKGMDAAILAAVEKITHIAEADERGTLIGEPVVSRGAIALPAKKIGICGGHTAAKFCTTTEVYPDSDRVTPAEANAAQVAVVVSGTDYALGKQ